ALPDARVAAVGVRRDPRAGAGEGRPQRPAREPGGGGVHAASWSPGRIGEDRADMAGQGVPARRLRRRPEGLAAADERLGLRLRRHRLLRRGDPAGRPGSATAAQARRDRSPWTAHMAGRLGYADLTTAEHWCRWPP